MADKTVPDQDRIRYCEKHEAHWIPQCSASEKGSSCPWCQRDVFWDELEYIYDTFLSAVASRESKGGQQVPYFGDFASIGPSTVGQMRRWCRRWAELLGKNIQRGA